MDMFISAGGIELQEERVLLSLSWRNITFPPGSLSTLPGDLGRRCCQTPNRRVERFPKLWNASQSCGTPPAPGATGPVGLIAITYKYSKKHPTGVKAQGALDFTIRHSRLDQSFIAPFQIKPGVGPSRAAPAGINYETTRGSRMKPDERDSTD
ncbi:hypothetical protein EYF80_041752 [Liparis tanakae]|uniref:Uncharacterized protein n=1 Tax=Liparis tanakae TaxID=230148 RepID=A0A4Z2G3B3_9TELE|nr:hypothetical protein EYF80_041752 [Liparis tanakae]